MSQQFPEITAEDFTRMDGQQPSYLQIEQALITLGGHGTDGMKFKSEALKAAGWTYHKMTSYASRADVAAKAFNRLRRALNSASDSAGLLAKLKND